MGQPSPLGESALQSQFVLPVSQTQWLESVWRSESGDGRGVGGLSGWGVSRADSGIRHGQLVKTHSAATQISVQSW